MEESKSPHPVDIIVGGRIRSARIARGVSQIALADQLGVSFQQVQKYENGSNRVSASRMVEIADILRVPATSFMEGLGAFEPGQDAGIAAGPDATGLLAIYHRLPPPMRGAVLQLAESLADGLGVGRAPPLKGKAKASAEGAKPPAVRRRRTERA